MKEKHDVFLVRKDNRYIYFAEDYGGQVTVLWTVYRYDAWNTRLARIARRVASRVGGAVEKFNLLTGEFSNG